MTETVTFLSDPEPAADLRAWLRDALPQPVRVTAVPVPAGPGDMGWAEVVQVIADVDLLGAVGTAVGMWLGSRIRRTRVRIQYRGREIEVEGNRMDDPEALIRRIKDMLDAEE